MIYFLQDIFLQRNKFDECFAISAVLCALCDAENLGRRDREEAQREQSITSNLFGLIKVEESARSPTINLFLIS
jgi:hypothetical protein